MTALRLCPRFLPAGECLNAVAPRLLWRVSVVFLLSVITRNLTSWTPFLNISAECFQEETLVVIHHLLDPMCDCEVMYLKNCFEKPLLSNSTSSVGGIYFYIKSLNHSRFQSALLSLGLTIALSQSLVNLLVRSHRVVYILFPFSDQAGVALQISLDALFTMINKGSDSKTAALF